MGAVHQPPPLWHWHCVNPTSPSLIILLDQFHQLSKRVLSWFCREDAINITHDHPTYPPVIKHGGLLNIELAFQWKTIHKLGPFSMPTFDDWRDFKLF
jgi:hypothetical protein